MSGRAGIDPELLPLLDALPAAPVDRDTLARIRALPLARPGAETPTVASVVRHAPGRDGAPAVPLHVHTPLNRAGPVACILHFHGGGFMFGAAGDGEAAHRRLVAQLGCALVSVDYRLAPETVYPGALDDGHAALAWVFDEARSLGIDPDGIGVMGESAGGGLAAALALLARDGGDYPLAFQHLTYPMLDDRTCLTASGDHPVWSARNNRFGWGALLGAAPGGDDVSCYAAPARAADLGGLPPTFLMTGALDLFADEDIGYARRLVAAGVPTELHVYPGAFHGFDLSPHAAVARAARRDALDALRRFVAGPSPDR